MIFNSRIVLRQVNNPESLSTTEIRNNIVEIVNRRLNVLGVFFSIGDIINEILELTEVSKVYLGTPVSNMQLDPHQYYTIANTEANLITDFTFDDTEGLAFGGR